MTNRTHEFAPTDDDETTCRLCPNGETDIIHQENICTRCDMAWGEDTTCEQCCDDDGDPRPRDPEKCNGWEWVPPTRPRYPTVILTAEQLPDDHEAWEDDTGRFSGVSRRWWNVCVIDQRGMAHYTTAAWDDDLEQFMVRVINDATRADRPSEAVMRLLDLAGRVGE